MDKLKKTKWRLIISAPSEGGWNMAVDEAILESVGSKTNFSTLRLYSWHPYCLSIGHAQSLSEINLAYINKAGWDLVRRPTGGRAILHADELTYSVCATLDDPHIQGGVVGSYRRISDCLLLALKKIGIHADSKPKIEEEKYLSKDPVCFQYPSDYEITFKGMKLIGSAQARRSNALLQHGSIPLFGDITRIISALKYESQEHKEKSIIKLRGRATTVANIAGKQISRQKFANAMIASFEEEFNLELDQQPLSPLEHNRTKQLLKEKFQNPDWTNRI